MKKVLMLVLMLMSIFSMVLAQETSFIKKATRNSYICSVRQSDITVRNQNSKYWGMDPKYNPDARTLPMPKFTLVNQDNMLKFIGRTFMPYVKKEQIGFGKNLFIDFSFNIKGEIEEVYFSYPKEVDVPITVIEQLEDYITGKCSMQFKANAVLEGVNYISYFIDYTFKNLSTYKDISE